MPIPNILRRRGAGRIPLIDAARGSAILAMFVFHLTWDLSYFGYIDPQIVFARAFSTFGDTIGSSFLAIAGASLVLAHATRFRARAYLRHLFTTGESLAGLLNTVHNLAHYLDTMRRVRHAIRLGELPGMLSVVRSEAAARRKEGPED